MRAHPLLSGFAAPDWVEDHAPPTVAQLQTLLPLAAGLQLIKPIEDGQHYEARIASSGQISTRPGSWHDAFNALIWSRWPCLKRALNRRQAADFAANGKHQRTRAQMAITHFDESGLVLLISDPALLDAWSRHDWVTLFEARRAAWGTQIVALPVGHALLEHIKLSSQLLLTAKAVAVLSLHRDPHDVTLAELDAVLAARMDARELLEDPQHPRPLPVSGIPGAWADQDASFYTSAECFRPLREGRAYPAAIVLD
jgi:hypothetical protein